MEKREIKFRRAHFDRDGKFEQFTYWGYIGGMFMPPTHTKQYEDGQYFRVEGIESCEGDVVKKCFYNHMNPRIAKVLITEDGCLSPFHKVMDYDGTTWIEYPAPREDAAFEILGNVYENPDLSYNTYD